MNCSSPHFALVGISVLLSDVSYTCADRALSYHYTQCAGSEGI